jgi:hypothetical protein
VDVERLERVCVIGSHEDDRRHVLGADLLDDAEAVEAGHLDVEEDEVGRELADCRDGLGAVCGFADDFDVRSALESNADTTSSERLVIDDERSDHRRSGRSS